MGVITVQGEKMIIFSAFWISNAVRNDGSSFITVFKIKESQWPSIEINLDSQWKGQLCLPAFDGYGPDYMN